MKAEVPNEGPVKFDKASKAPWSSKALMVVAITSSSFNQKGNNGSRANDEGSKWEPTFAEASFESILVGARPLSFWLHFFSPTQHFPTACRFPFF